jgi:death-on-curing protein
MEIPLDEEWLKTLYNVLISIYKNTDDPIRSGFPIVSDYNKSILSACVNRPKTKIFRQTIYPYVLQRAAVTMHSIINFHPFVDGNKRVALLSVRYYLFWNGYNFVIPIDADDFTIRVAKDRLSINDILIWLKQNSKRTPYNVIRHWMCATALSGEGTVTASKVFVDEALRLIFFPTDGLRFFRNKIIQEHRKKMLQKKNGSSVCAP